MPLPENNTPWPPAAEQGRYQRMRVTSAWYSGDSDELAVIYGGQANGWGLSHPVSKGSGTGTWTERARQRISRWFWAGVPSEGQADDKMHVPVAQDIATVSSELLFSTPPSVRVKPPEGMKPDSPEVVKVQERLDLLLDKSNFNALLLAAGETGAALGASGLRIAWDKELAPDRAFITRTDADAMVVDTQWGIQTAVTFWRVVQRDGETYIRHLERHERGRILHGLYQGTADNLGIAIPLAENSATARLAESVNEEGAIATVEGHRTGFSVANMLPDPTDRVNAVGRSDFTPGVINLFDAIDRTYSSMMRDIDLAKGRLIVADYMLDDQGTGKGAAFNTDQSVFSPLNMAPSEDREAPITLVQFDIRVAEHIQAIDHLIGKAVKSCGYSPQTMGDEGGGVAITATESNSRDKRSLSTRDKKILYWKSTLEEMLAALLAVDAAQFPSGGSKPYEVEVEFADSTQTPMLELAQTALAMNTAVAASVKTRVETLHPDWDEKAVQDEVDLIMEEQGKTVQDPENVGTSPQPPAPGEVIGEGGDVPPEDGSTPPVPPQG